MALSLLKTCQSRSPFMGPFCKIPSSLRYLNSGKNLHRKSIYKTEEAKKIRFYVIHRYLEYLKNYDKVLERSFPGAMQVYRVFSVGIKDFIGDLKNYIRIVRLINTPGQRDKFLNLTRREIELYHQMPKDMRKVAPVLLVSALPLANYVVFPLAYLFPRHFLSSHFWTLQQKHEFSLINLTNRLVYNRDLFRCVQAELDDLRGHKAYREWAVILGKMGSGVQPKVEEIVRCKDLFMSAPYHLFYLTRKHVKYLLKIHNLHTGWFRRARLAERARILKEMDRAIMREGGVHNLPIESLKNACFIRGLSPVNMRTDDMIQWLNNWITISLVVDKENLSLLLHCPILLAYNEPSNWQLIYSKK